MKDFMTPNDGDLEFKDASGGPETKQGPDTNEIKTQLDAYDRTVQAFMTKTDETLADLKRKGSIDLLDNESGKKMQADLDGLKKSIDGLRLQEARPSYLDANGQKTLMSDDELDYQKKFDSFFRRGKNADYLEEKTLSVGSDPDGGVVVPAQMEGTIDRVITEVSPMRAHARVVQVTTASYKKRMSMGGATSGWVAEQAGRPNTDTPVMDVLEFPVMEIYANPSATQSILDDASIDIDQWLADEVAIEFASQEAQAFTLGNGATRPRGFTTYDMVEEDNWQWGKMGYRATGVSGDWADSSSDAGAEATNIIDLVYALNPKFRANARFSMNRKTVSNIMKLRDADGRPLWHTNLREGQPDSLMGYPVMENEDMADIAANSLSMAFGDFRRGYLIVDRMGTRVLRDPFSAKPYIQFYTTRRVGGGVSDYQAIKFLKFGTS